MTTAGAEAMRSNAGQAHGEIVREPSLSVWFPLSSIASTSHACGPGLKDATNSGETVTDVVVPGTVTSNFSTMTW